jgi:hypothetical protein
MATTTGNTATKRSSGTTRKSTARKSTTRNTTRSTAAKSPSQTTGRRTRTTAQNKTRQAAKANATATKTTAKQGRTVAERAGLVYVGAVLEARDRVNTVATDVVETFTTRRGVTLRRLERRGQTETRKARTRAQRLIRRGERRFDRETNAVARETQRRSNPVTHQVVTVAGRIEDTVQAGVAAGERVVKTLA